MTKTYQINEIFYSLQGEGGRAGEPSIFVRFTGCNLKCTVGSEEGGFDCDTEFASGRKMDKVGILHEISKFCTMAPNLPWPWIVWTGGEPSLQLDDELVKYFHEGGFKQAIETNGTNFLPPDLDWICVSPKTAEHTIRVTEAHEVKYVRRSGQGIPRPKCTAPLQYISPAFDAEGLRGENLKWCIELVKQHPNWRLSLQQHKLWGVR